MGEKTNGTVLAPPRISSKKGKLRPTDAAGLVAAIDNGRLDQRTTPARKIISLRAAIAAAPLEAAQGIIRDVLAVNLAISQAITSEIGRPGFQVLLPGGELNPLLAGHWQETQKSLLNAARLLIQTETKANSEAPANGEIRAASVETNDLTALILHEDTD